MPDDGALLSLFAQRQPPANLVAEQCVLGALLANNKAYDEVATFLQPDHFADPVNGRIYAAIARRIGGGHLADAISLRAEFEHSGVLDEVGGTTYLAQLLAAMVSPRYVVREYGLAIRDCWVRRQAIDAAETLRDRASGADPQRNGDTVVTEAIDSLLRLGEQAASGASGPRSLADALGGAVARAEAAHRGDAGASRLDTGVRTFDALWQGLWPGQLYYLMARSRTGKTQAMLQIARNVAGRLLGEAEQAQRDPEHVHILSLEMTAEDVGTTNLANTTRWTADQIRAGEIGDAAAWVELDQARAALARLPIVIDDEPEVTISAVMTRARIVARTHRTRLLLIDFGELIRRGKEESRMGLPEWIPLLGYRLKALAKALNVPVVALRQINKSRDSQDSTRPTLGDLPYDGGQAADAVFCLHRPELAMGDEPPENIGGARSEELRAKLIAQWRETRERARGVAEFGALKRRFGPTGWRRMRFNGPRMLFEDMAEEEPPPPSGEWWQEH